MYFSLNFWIIVIYALIKASSSPNIPIIDRIKAMGFLGGPFLWCLGVTAIVADQNATSNDPMEYWTRTAGVVIWIDSKRVRVDSLQIATIAIMKDPKLKIWNTWKNGSSDRTSFPSLLNPPGGVIAAVKVTVAISVVTTRLKLDSDFCLSCSMADVFGLLKSLLIFCWRNGSPTQDPNWCKTVLLIVP